MLTFDDRELGDPEGHIVRVLTRHGLDPEAPRELTALGGPGSGNWGHTGTPGRGGSPPKGGGRGRFEITDDVKATMEGHAALAAKQTHPYANPVAVLGFSPDGGRDFRLEQPAQNYVKAFGQPFKSQKRPADVWQGTPNECYKNASLLVLEREDLTYAEGFAGNGSGLAIWHAWAVDEAGKVVDPTLPDGEKWQYFGVKYDRASYLANLYKAKFYGVIGGTDKQAWAAITTDGKALRTPSTEKRRLSPRQKKLLGLQADAELEALGGPGSGNWGHGGTPGRGGSPPKGSGSTPQGEFVVEHVQDEVHGGDRLTIYLDKSTVSARKTDKGLILDYIEVDEDKQRQGIGTRLVNKLRQEAGDEPVRTAGFATHEGRALFESLVKRGIAEKRVTFVKTKGKWPRTVPRVHYEFLPLRALGGPGSGNWGHGGGVGGPGNPGGSTPGGGLRVVGSEAEAAAFQQTLSQVPPEVRKLSETRVVEVVPKHSIEERTRQYMAQHYGMTEAEYDIFTKGRTPTGLIDRERRRGLAISADEFFKRQFPHTMPKVEGAFKRMQREGMLHRSQLFDIFGKDSPVLEVMDFTNVLTGIMHIPPVKSKLQQWGIL